MESAREETTDLEERLSDSLDGGGRHVEAFVPASARSVPSISSKTEL